SHKPKISPSSTANSVIHSHLRINHKNYALQLENGIPRCLSPVNSLSWIPSLLKISMAAVLESLAVPRSSVAPSSTLTPVAASLLSSFPGARKSVHLPEFNGLKIQSSASSRNFKSVTTSRGARRAGRIVCESPETAVEC
ncbi:hypothetical protein Ancab_005825, partial [Ancistrocladus abbreviatus]